MIKIGIWGPTKVGKSTFLCILLYLLESRRSLTVEPLGGESTQYYEAYKTDFVQKGVFPEPTPPPGGTLELRIRLTNPVGNAVELHLMDISGFNIGITPNSARGAASQGMSPEREKLVEKYLDTLAAADGGLVMFNSRVVCDPYSADRTNPDVGIPAYKQLRQAINRVGKKSDAMARAIHYKYAICLTQVDMPRIWPDYNGAGSKSTWVKNSIWRFWRGNAVERTMMNMYEDRGDLRYFGVSSVGGGNGNLIVRKGSAEIITNPKLIQPVNVIEPINWILQSVNAPFLL